MRTVALEEHFSLPGMVKRIDKKVIAAHGWPSEEEEGLSMKKAQPLLPETGQTRLQSMDEAGITVQVLSVSGPGAEMLPLAESITFARDYNTTLAQITATRPDRFAAFAHLPMTAPEAAAEELERTVKEFHFCGAMINGMTNGLFLDDARFAPVLARAEVLEVPLYLHPSFPPTAVQEVYYKRVPSAAASAALASAAFGWHAEVAVHILRLIVSGTLDRYPRLQLIIGHMGEMLPFMMQRSEMILSKELTGLHRSVTEILRRQVNITTSGVFTAPPFQNAIDTFGIDRILFSVDYPFAKNEQGRAFLNSLSLSTEDMEKLTHGNADRLLKLDKR